MLNLERHFTKEGIDVYSMFKWSKRDASIKNLRTGTMIYQNDGLNFPTHFSDQAVSIVADKYFKQKDVPETGSEKGFDQLANRVVISIANYGKKLGYFKSEEETNIFVDELLYLIYSQKYSFNSPVWFNAGLFDIYSMKGNEEGGLFYWDPEVKDIKKASYANERPQGSACFILNLEDRLGGEDGIADWYTTEMMVFKSGSGTGVNLSKLRAKGEPLSGGGSSSGPISYACTTDNIAGTIKSGGKTRRAAKMVIMNVDHPEVLEFIDLKIGSEIQARSLAGMGYDPNDVYDLVPWQNQNNSVRVTDEFMEAVLNDGGWSLIERLAPHKTRKVPKAQEVMTKIVGATYIAGDPGIQFDSTVNRWNTCPNSFRINASNPCSEYMFLDNSACNLGSFNLANFVDMKNSEFDIKGFKNAVKIAMIAQDIIIDYSGYPRKAIAKNSHMFRPIGLGYANLGHVLMSLGIPYDSEEGRSFAAGVSSLMTGYAYKVSAEIAEDMGAFDGFEKNKEPMMNVIAQHKEAALDIRRLRRGRVQNLESIIEAGNQSWEEAIKKGENSGFRNSQVSLLAPTGTISFIMNCNTTGVEPVQSHSTEKNLVGGGIINLANEAIPIALQKLDYTNEEIKNIVEYVAQNKTIEGAPGLKEKHLAIFDCTNCGTGQRYLSTDAHLNMMAAVQPFLSGAISKTVNIPFDASLEEIYNTYIQAWRLGLKSVAIYRDASKLKQPLSSAKKKSDSASKGPEEKKWSKIELPQYRDSLTVETQIKNMHDVFHNVHIIFGEDEFGDVKEVRIQMFRGGSLVKDLLGDLGVSISKGMKGGVPLEYMVSSYIGTRNELGGETNDQNMPTCTSLEDYISKVAILQYLGVERYQELTGDFNFDLKPGTLLRKDITKNSKLANKYAAEISLINTIRSLKSVQEIKEFDKKNKNGGKLRFFHTNVPTRCGCGGEIKQDAKCSRCCNCGRTYGGCSL